MMIPSSIPVAVTQSNHSMENELQATQTAASQGEERNDDKTLDSVHISPG